MLVLLQLHVHKEHKVPGEGQGNKGQRSCPLTSLDPLFANQCFCKLIKEVILLSYLLVQRVINCYLLKVI